MPTNLLDQEMAKRKAPKTQSAKLSEGAMQWARIASGYTGESIAEYLSRIVEERAKQDAERLHAELTGHPLPRPKGESGSSKK